MELWAKIALVALITLLVYREIIKSASKVSVQAPKKQANFLSLIAVGIAVGIFVYAGMSISFIETRDLRPIHTSGPELVSIYDKGIIEVGGLVIKTNLASATKLAPLANELTQGCNRDDGCEVQKLFDYVTNIPYKTDYTSRNALEVIRTNWGDCDDKSNLFASLLNERGIDYRFVYVAHHVFVVVHVEDTKQIPFLNARLRIDGRDYYYAETTAAGAKIGTFNGMFPYKFIGVYDLKAHKEDDLKNISFMMI
jgi:hypothetical protein